MINVNVCIQHCKLYQSDRKYAIVTNTIISELKISCRSVIITDGYMSIDEY
jgi:hypothetical protein